MQKVTIVEEVGEFKSSEIICESWSCWQDGPYLSFLFLNVQKTATREAQETLRHMSRAVETVTSHKVDDHG